MNWQEIRQRHPQTWLLAEALQTSVTKDRWLYVGQWTVIALFPDWKPAWEQYKMMKRESPKRELFVLHSDRETVEIKVRYWPGVRRRITNPA